MNKSFTIIYCEEVFDRTKTFDSSFRVRFIYSKYPYIVHVRRRIGETEYQIYPDDYKQFVKDKVLDHVMNVLLDKAVEEYILKD